MSAVNRYHAVNYKTLTPGFSIAQFHTKHQDTLIKQAAVLIEQSWTVRT